MNVLCVVELDGGKVNGPFTTCLCNRYIFGLNQKKTKRKVAHFVIRVKQHSLFITLLEYKYKIPLMSVKCARLNGLLRKKKAILADKLPLGTVPGGRWCASPRFSLD
ncbi:unnamed protein product [Clavelina lepadiformis]|uniref:Uncharacterized protein n=1 Tax=Clavelina lepadiformis TaxID=159417 RepID=A0ABP0FDW5_CLALP